MRRNSFRFCNDLLKGFSFFFCSFGNPLSYFVGVNAARDRPYYTTNRPAKPVYSRGRACPCPVGSLHYQCLGFDLDQHTRKNQASPLHHTVTIPTSPQQPPPLLT